VADEFPVEVRTPLEDRMMERRQALEKLHATLRAECPGGACLRPASRWVASLVPALRFHRHRPAQDRVRSGILIIGRGWNYRGVLRASIFISEIGCCLT
jgi:hypothetical protein